jgi:hypothetical protein
MFTVDLRPVLGVAGGMGNLSGLDAAGVDVDSGSLWGTVRSAMVSMAEAEASIPGLASQVLAERATPFFGPLWPWPSVGPWWTRNAQGMVFSNVGRIPEALSDWGDANLIDLHIVPPQLRVPVTVTTASSFRGRLSLVARQPAGAAEQAARTVAAVRDAVAVVAGLRGTALG